MTTSSRAISALLSLSTSSASKLAAHPLLSFLKDPLLSSSYFPRRRLLLLRPYSTTATSYPLYYELIDHRPPPRRPRRRNPSSVPAASDPCSSSPGAADDVDDPDAAPLEQTMDRSKRKYYRKRRQRMFGGSSDSDDASGGLPGSESGDGEYIELKPEIVDFPRLHAREEELYFYDAFAYPWEKEKHYRMVYQLERKYFPEHSLDKAFVDPGAAEQVKSSGEAAPPGGLGKTRKKRGKSAARSKVKEEDHVEDEQRDEKALIFFDSEKKEDSNTENLAPRGVTEKKVEDFFKCLRKVPNPGDARRTTREEEEASEPYLVSRKTELPPRWDGPSGTVVLVNKSKG